MRSRAAFVICAAAAFAVHANSIPNDFAYDDYAIILKNPRVQDLANWQELLAEPYWPGGGGAGAGLYRPVTSLTYAVDWALWGGRAPGFHLANVCWHVLVTVLVLVLLLRLFRPWAALAGALLFAVHPVHTEAVANVVGRAEILGAAFVLAALLVLGMPRGAGPGVRERPREAGVHGASMLRVAGASLLYALGILSKESAIVAPGLLVVADAVRGGFSEGWRAYVRRRGPAYAALAAGGLAALSIRWVVLGSPAAADPAAAFVPDASFPTRFFTMIRVWPHYARLLLAPFDLSADYSPAVILPVREITAHGLLGLGLAAGVFALALYGWRRDRRLAAGIAWIVVALFPASNLLFVTGIVLAERTLYLPSVGISLLLSLAWERAATIPRARLLAVAYAALLAAFAVRTVARNPEWRNGAAIFNSLRREHPESYVAHWVLASDLVRRGRSSEATRWYESAYRIWPYSYTLALDLAGHYLRTGEAEKAAGLAAQAAKLEPRAVTPWELRVLALYRQARFEEVARLAVAAPAMVRASPRFAYVVAAVLEGGGEGGDEGRGREWERVVQTSVQMPETWITPYEVARLQLERGDTMLARDALAAAYRAAVGDSIGLGLLAALARELGS